MNTRASKLLLALAAVVALWAPHPASAARADADPIRAPYKAGGCADFVGSFAESYDGMGHVTLDAARGVAGDCSGVTYTLSVYRDVEGTQLITQVTGAAAGDHVVFDTTFDVVANQMVGKTAVYVVGTTGDARGVIDRAPNAGTYRIGVTSCDPSDVGCPGTNFR